MNSSTLEPVEEYDDDVMFASSVALFLACIAAVGVLGNLLIVFTVCVDRKLRVPGNALVINLAVVDLVITAYLMPIGIATSQSHIEPFTHALCDAHAVLLMTVCCVSTQSVMLIAIERYVRICSLNRYDTAFNYKTVTLYISLLWLYGLAWAVQGLTGWTHYENSSSIYLCVFDVTHSVTYDVSLSVLGVIVPAIVMLYCYVNIFRTVSKSKTAIASHTSKTSRDDKQSSKNRQRDYQFRVMLVIIVVTFSVCWLPCACVIILSGVLNSGAIPDIVYTVVVWIALCNSTLNSIIYGVMNMNFRRGYVSLAQKLCCFCCPHSSRCACARQSLDGSSADEETHMPAAGGRSNTYRSNMSSARSDITDFSTLPPDVASVMTKLDNHKTTKRNEKPVQSNAPSSPLQKLSQQANQTVKSNLKSQPRHELDVKDKGHVNSAFSDDITFKAQY